MSDDPTKANRERVGRQLNLPTREAVKISIRSLKIRFWRSIITGAGVFLGIAFLLSVVTSSYITRALDPDDEIVVYCSNETCFSSISVYYLLKKRGYKHVSRYAGGLLDWGNADYPLEGEMAFAH